MEPLTEFWSPFDCISLLFRKRFKLTRSPSSIHGRGVVTQEFIPKDSILGVSTDEINGHKISSMFNDGDFTYPSKFYFETLISTLDKYQKSSLSNIRVIKTVTDDFFIYKANRDIKPGEELTRKYGAQKWSFWLTIHVSVDDGIIQLDDLSHIESSKEITHDDSKHESIQNPKIQALIDAWNHFGYVLTVTKKKD